MKRLLNAFLIAALLTAPCAYCEEDGITVEHVQAVAAGDGETPASESEGEDAADYLQAQEDEKAENSVGTAQLDFEEGFTLSVPADWLYYSVTDDMTEKGVIYALSDAGGEHHLYIQSWSTDCADIEALNTLIQNTSSPTSSNIHEFNGIPFVVYDLPDDDVSCAAALVNGKVLNLEFTPQSDTDFMLTAAEIMQSFRMTADTGVSVETETAQP